MAVSIFKDWNKLFLLWKENFLLALLIMTTDNPELLEKLQRTWPQYFTLVEPEIKIPIPESLLDMMRYYPMLKPKADDPYHYGWDNPIKLPVIEVRLREEHLIHTASASLGKPGPQNGVFTLGEAEFEKVLEQFIGQNYDRRMRVLFHNVECVLVGGEHLLLKRTKKETPDQSGKKEWHFVHFKDKEKIRRRPYINRRHEGLRLLPAALVDFDT